MNHIISVLVENKAGVLAKVSGLFRRRGYNIDSVSVGTTEDEKFSTITMVVSGKTHSIEQVIKQLYKLINVIKIKELDPFSDVEKELVLIRVNTNSTKRKEIMEIVNILGANVIDIEKKSILIGFSGSGRKIKTIEELLRPFGILELVRSGKVACAWAKLE